MEGGTAHGWERNLCVFGVPLPLYIKEQGGRGAASLGARQEESYSYRE